MLTNHHSRTQYVIHKTHRLNPISLANPNEEILEEFNAEEIQEKHSSFWVSTVPQPCLTFSFSDWMKSSAPVEHSSYYLRVAVSGAGGHCYQTRVGAAELSVKTHFRRYHT